MHCLRVSAKKYVLVETSNSIVRNTSTFTESQALGSAKLRPP